MLCPSCGEEDNRVVYTYPSKIGNTTMRVRKCQVCDWVWKTEEKERMEHPRRVLN